MIREMGIDDIAQVVELEKECFKEPWGIDNVRYEIEGNPFSHGWILEQDGCIHAYAFLWETFETAQLARIGVHPARRRLHHADTLLKALERRAALAGCEVVTLEVRSSNDARRKLYEKNGFIPINVSKKYYPDGEDAVIMTKPVGWLD